MTPTEERIFGGLLGLLVCIIAIIALSPFLNWWFGYGFRWHF